MPDEFDFDAAVTSLGADLGFSSSEGNDHAGTAGDLGAVHPAGDAGGGSGDLEGATGGGTGAGTAAGNEGTQQGENGATQGTVEGADAPPKTWRKEAAATWAALPPEARAEILKREEDIFKGIEGYKEHASLGKSVRDVLAPYDSILRQYNIDPIQQIRGLMDAHYTLATGTAEQKQALFAKLARDYQVDFSTAGLTGEPPYVDPTVKALQTELHGVKSMLTEQQQARAREVQQATQRQIDAFAADPKNIHFNDVLADMTALVQGGVCKTLEEAYERAVWMNPAVRAREISRQQAEASEKAAKEAAAKAEAARKATAANVRTSAKSGSAAAPLGSIDDTLNETLAGIRSRG